MRMGFELTLDKKIKELEKVIKLLNDGKFYYASGQLELKLFDLRRERNQESK